MTIPGSSRTSASSEPRSNRLWLAALALYAIAGLGDLTAHLAQDAHAGRDWRQPGNLAVAFSASLFWPVDLIAAALLGR